MSSFLLKGGSSNTEFQSQEFLLKKLIGRYFSVFYLKIGKLLLNIVIEIESSQLSLSF